MFRRFWAPCGSLGCVSVTEASRVVGLSTCARDFCPTPSTVKILHILGGRPHVLLPLKSILAQYLDPGTLCRPCSLFSICEACLKISLYQFNTTNPFNQSRLSRLPRLSTNTSSQYKVRNRIFMIETVSNKFTIIQISESMNGSHIRKTEWSPSRPSTSSV